MNLDLELVKLLNQSPEKISKLNTNKIWNKLNSASHIFIYGAGQNGKFAADLLIKNGLKLSGFLDETLEKQGQSINNVKIFSPSEAAEKFTGNILVIISPFSPKHSFLRTEKKFLIYNWQVISFVHLGMIFPNIFLPFYFFDEAKNIINAKDKYLTLLNKLEDERSKQELIAHLAFRLDLDFNNLLEPIGINFEYFTAKLSSDIIYIDGGAYDGDSISAFIEVFKDKFNLILGFEPDKYNYNKLLKTIEGFPELREKIQVKQVGLWLDSNIIGFKSFGNTGSHIDLDALEKMHVTSIDEVVPPNKNLFIKLDVEGAEYEAIIGAKNSFIAGKTFAMIAVYHKANDLWRLSELISNINNNYKFALRSHAYDGADLMLYAYQ